MKQVLEDARDSLKRNQENDSSVCMEILTRQLQRSLYIHCLCIYMAKSDGKIKMSLHFTDCLFGSRESENRETCKDGSICKTDQHSVTLAFHSDMQNKTKNGNLESFHPKIRNSMPETSGGRVHINPSCIIFSFAIGKLTSLSLQIPQLLYF